MQKRGWDDLCRWMGLCDQSLQVILPSVIAMHEFSKTLDILKMSKTNSNKYDNDSWIQLRKDDQFSMKGFTF